MVSKRHGFAPRSKRNKREYEGRGWVDSSVGVGAVRVCGCSIGRGWQGRPIGRFCYHVGDHRHCHAECCYSSSNQVSVTYPFPPSIVEPSFLIPLCFFLSFFPLHRCFFTLSNMPLWATITAVVGAIVTAAGKGVFSSLEQREREKKESGEGSRMALRFPLSCFLSFCFAFRLFASFCFFFSTMFFCSCRSGVDFGGCVQSGQSA